MLGNNNHASQSTMYVSSCEVTNQYVTSTILLVTSHTRYCDHITKLVCDLTILVCDLHANFAGNRVPVCVPHTRNFDQRFGQYMVKWPIILLIYGHIHQSCTRLILLDLDFVGRHIPTVGHGPTYVTSRLTYVTSVTETNVTGKDPDVTYAQISDMGGNNVVRLPRPARILH